MTTVKCNEYECIFNKDKSCTKEEIEIIKYDQIPSCWSSKYVEAENDKGEL